ncbi:MAG TPA: CbrC family protein [Polyangiaceae bacterium]|nr:CbrC family protein [Polyangiaceae bacterium]
MSSAERLPAFKYHPDPLGTGSIKVSDAVCECCGQARGYSYSAAVYAIQNVEVVCPWCIADGSLARRFDATLVDAGPLVSAGLSSAIVDEVTRRTPGYLSWQQESWIACCDDACEFHGDAPRAEIRDLDEVGMLSLSSESGFTVEDLRSIIEQYEPRGSPAFYKFVCRHCRRVRYNGDCD